MKVQTNTLYNNMTRTIRKDGYVSVYDKGEQYLEHRRLAGVELSNIYNVSRALISQIKNNKRWN